MEVETHQNNDLVLLQLLHESGTLVTVNVPHSVAVSAVLAFNDWMLSGGRDRQFLILSAGIKGSDKSVPFGSYDFDKFHAVYFEGIYGR